MHRTAIVLNKIGENIWTVEGDAVSFFGMPYTTRMTLIKLTTGDIWVHSPLNISQNLIKEVSALGKVKYLVSPNKLHHIFIADWMRAFPKAICYAPPGLVKKRRDITFDKELGMLPEAQWSTEIKQTIFKGSPAMQEVVFFHTSSKTLILADLIENFNPNSFNWWQRILARMTGILAPHGKTPIDWRLSFICGVNEARKSLSIILSWEPDVIVISHGECILGNGVRFLQKSFLWLKL